MFTLVSIIDVFNTPALYLALIVGIFISISAALISPYIVLNHESMLADGLSHASFFGFTFALIFMNDPIYIAVIIAVVVSFLLRYVTRNTNIKGDSAVGIISAVGFAAGLLIINKRDFNVSVESIIQGNLLTSGYIDLYLSIAIFIITLVFIIVFYRPLLSITFDKEYSKFSKINDSLISYLLSAIISVLIVISIRLIGTLLISAFLIFPILIANQFKFSFKNTIILSVVVSLIAFLTAYWISIFANLPPGPTIIILDFVILIVAFFATKLIYHKKGVKG